MHTLETLLPLLDSPEGLEKLRILAAEADGVPLHYKLEGQESYNKWMMDGVCFFLKDFPHYPTSLDAIFAAEERLGLHDPKNRRLRNYWENMFFDLLREIQERTADFTDIYFASPAIRTAVFIPTAQYKKEKGL